MFLSGRFEIFFFYGRAHGNLVGKGINHNSQFSILNSQFSYSQGGQGYNNQGGQGFNRPYPAPGGNDPYPAPTYNSAYPAPGYTDPYVARRYGEGQARMYVKQLRKY